MACGYMLVLCRASRAFEKGPKMSNNIFQQIQTNVDQLVLTHSATEETKDAMTSRGGIEPPCVTAGLPALVCNLLAQSHDPPHYLYVIYKKDRIYKIYKSIQKYTNYIEIYKTYTQKKCKTKIQNIQNIQNIENI